jgi:hypothetical protein
MIEWANNDIGIANGAECHHFPTNHHCPFHSHISHLSSLHMADVDGFVPEYALQRLSISIRRELFSLDGSD